MITVCYISNRKEPRIKWLFKSLERQIWEAHERDENNLQHQFTRLVVVDKWAEAQEGWSDEDVWKRREEFKNMSSWTFHHVPPKPTVWAGPHRLTKRDYFCPSNARNTGLCYADPGQIVYIDDLSVLMPGWFESVIKAVYGNYIALGTYRKVNKLVVKDGLVESFEDHPSGHDTRLSQLQSDDDAPAHDSWVFGCSIVIPVEALLAINGWNEYLCDSMGFEDVALGCRLKRAGYELRICPKMRTFESEECHHIGTPALRIIKPYPGYQDASWALVDFVRNGDHIFAKNQPDIRELRQRVLAGEPFPIPTEPTHHWPDGAALKDM